MTIAAQSRRSYSLIANRERAPELSSERSQIPRLALFIVLALGSLCFGATESWSILMLETGAVGTFVLWLALSWRHLHVQVDLPSVVLPLFGALVASQLVFKVSVYDYATEQELLKIVAYFLFFFLSHQLFRSHERDSSSTLMPVIFGAAVAVFAIVQKLQGNGQIYWTRATTTESFFGPYANKNHYAGLMEMLLPFAFAGAGDVNSEISKRAISAFAASVMAASVVLSGSRTGILVVLTQLALFAGLLLLRGKRSRSRVSVPLVVWSLVLIAWLAAGALGNQIAGLRDSATQASMFNRIQVARDSVELVRQRPILGWGLGTFPIVYPQVATWYSDFAINAAHDDYLQLLVETGIAGLVLVLLFLILVFRAGIHSLLDAPTGIGSCALLGCFALLLHSFTDFNLHVPANAAIFFALCGTISSASDLPLTRAYSEPTWS